MKNTHPCERGYTKFIMKVDHCFILAAGFGTRMGTIGTKLPKVFWPVFEKSILELQVEFARSLGINSIACNLHYQKELILDRVRHNKAFSDVEFLVEDKILDIGGGIHNFARKKDYKGNVLVLNSDQFLMFDQESLEEIKDTGQVATLFTKKVSKKEKYNQLLIEKSILKDIIPNQTSTQEYFDTYTGCGVINLEKLIRIDGASSFFQSVATFKKSKIICIDFYGKEYNDFGTKKRYFESIHALLKGSRPILKKFLIQHQALKSYDKGSYDGAIKVEENYIDLEGRPQKNDRVARIYYQELVDTI